MPRTLSLLAVLKKVDAKGVKSLSNAQWDTFLASDTEPNEIQDKIKKLEGYEEKGVNYDATGELIVEDNNAMIERFRQRTGRAAGRESLKVKKSKVNIGEFLGRGKGSQKLLTGTVDKSQNPPIDFDQKDVTPDKKKVASGGLGDTINSIAETVARIETTLISQKKLDEDKQKNDKQLLENLKRDNEESRLGKVTGFLKKTGDKIIAPVQNIFGKIFGFIKKLILGKILLNILKWFGNPANQGKLDSVIKFFSQNWKKLLSLYLIFGTGIGRFVRFITKVAIKGTIKLIALLAKLAAAKKIKGARGIAKFFGGKKGAILGTAITAVGTVGMYAGMNKMLEGDEEPQKFNKGGKVRGQGDRDTVPAMLTPGEFVMSKGAVQKYGVGTMEAMNAAAGGTNVPVLMSNKKRKGYNDGALVVKEDNNAISKEDKEWILSEVNKERALAGNIVSGDPLAPLKADAIKYSKDASIIKGKGKEHYFGPEKDEKIETRTNVDTMERTVIHTLNGETTTKTYKLSNEQAKAWLKEQGIPAMELADGTIVGDTAALAYDNSVAELANMRARLGEQSPAALAEFNALPDVIAMDKAIADGSLRKEIVTNSRKHKKGTKENLMQKNMNRILEMDGDEGIELKEHMFKNNTVTETTTDRVKYAGGGLVLGYNGGGSPITGGDALSGKVKFTKAEIEALNQQYNPEINDQIRDLQTRVNDLSRSAVGGWKSKKDYNEYRKLNRQLKYVEYQKRMGRTSAVNLDQPSSSGKNQSSISNKSEKNPANFSQPQGSGGGFGLKRMIGGMADMATGHMFDFDKRSGGGLLRKTANAVGKTASGIGKGLSRAAGGTADMLTGNLFDFDNKSGGGLIRKTANALGSLFGGSKPIGDKVMGKEPKIKEIKIPAEGLESILIKIASKQDIKTPVGQPSLSGPKITVIPEKKSINAPTGDSGGGGGKPIPKFNAGYGSVRKMKQLGISR